jgi:hypothetical protein
MVESALMIVEHRAPWETWALGWCGRNRQLILLIQQAAESPAEFRKRIASRIEGLHASHCRLDHVVLVPNPQDDVETRLARTSLLALVRRALRNSWTTTRVLASKTANDA